MQPESLWVSLLRSGKGNTKIDSGSVPPRRREKFVKLSQWAGWRDSRVKSGSQTHTAVWICFSWPLTKGHEDTQINCGAMGLSAALSEVLCKILMQLGQLEASG